MKPSDDQIVSQFSDALRDPKSIVAQTSGGRFADYDKEKLAPLAQELVGYSFGCGDPLAFSQGGHYLDRSGPANEGRAQDRPARRWAESRQMLR